MSGLVKGVWMGCTIAFVLLLPYVVLKRRLWLPGLMATAFTTFGRAKLPLPVVGFVRVQLLLAICSVLVVGFILAILKRRAQNLPSLRGRWDWAPVLLIALLVWMVLRTLIEYAFTGESFLPYEIVDLTMTTTIPCLILLMHPGQEDALERVLQGIVIGAILAMLPALVDFESISSVWSALTTDSTVLFHRFGYRDRNTVARWAIQAAMCLASLGSLKTARKGWVYHAMAVFFAVFGLIQQSRRWFLGLSLFSVLYYVLVIGSGRFEREVLTRKKAGRARQMAVAALMVGIIAFAAMRFQRYAFKVFSAELSSAYTVPGAAYRAGIWDRAIRAWREQPWFGLGLSGFGLVVYSVEPGTGSIMGRHIGAHSAALGVLVQYGVVGALLSASFLLSMLAFSVRWLKKGDHLLREQLSLVLAYWLGLFAPYVSAGAVQRLATWTLLPCAAYLVVKRQRGEWKKGQGVGSQPVVGAIEV